MTKNFERYIYPLLHTNPSDYFGSEYGSAEENLQFAWRRLGIKYPENICSDCENLKECPFRSRSNRCYTHCNFYEKKELEKSNEIMLQSE